MSTEIVLATGNAGKVREFQAILSDLPLEFSSLSAYPEISMPEEGDDYEENARVKALTVAKALGKLAVADDSGLEVEALGWRPGPHSARYGGPGLSDTDRVEKLLEEMMDVPVTERAARFVCVAALATPGGEVFTVRGECHGAILEEPRGAGGFGYDPVFFVHEEGRAMAELPEALKHRISHRGCAFAGLREALLGQIKGEC